jgi:hypothetical protein
LHNLRANPQVEAQIGRTRHQVTATEIGHDDPEFARLWKLVNDNNGGLYAPTSVGPRGRSPWSRGRQRRDRSGRQAALGGWGAIGARNATKAASPS